MSPLEVDLKGLAALCNLGPLRELDLKHAIFGVSASKPVKKLVDLWVAMGWASLHICEPQGVVLYRIAAAGLLELESRGLVSKARSRTLQLPDSPHLELKKDWAHDLLSNSIHLRWDICRPCEHTAFLPRPRLQQVLKLECQPTGILRLENQFLIAQAIEAHCQFDEALPCIEDIFAKNRLNAAGIVLLTPNRCSERAIADAKKRIKGLTPNQYTLTYTRGGLGASATPGVLTQYST